MSMVNSVLQLVTSENLSGRVSSETGEVTTCKNLVFF